MKLAFCFLIYDIINHEDLWNTFFTNVDNNKYNIYIHYKTNKQLKYFENYKLKYCIPTQYAHISLVLAQNLLLSEGLKDNENEHFIFLSGSCIPLKSFDYVYNNLNKSYSYFNITPVSQCFPRCNDALHYIDRKYIHKTSQWCILNKKHAQLMIDKKEYIKWFENNGCPDEHCYITNIFFNGLQNEIITTPNLATGATTFTNWADMDYKYVSNHGLKNYSFIAIEEIVYLLNSKSMFGRKFTVECANSLNNDVYIKFIKS